MSDRLVLSFHLFKVIHDDSSASMQAGFESKNNFLVQNCALVFFNLKVFTADS